MNLNYGIGLAVVFDSVLWNFVKKIKWAKLKIFEKLAFQKNTDIKGYPN